jgi:hypothetical protein
MGFLRLSDEADSDAQKKELFGKVRSGEVRILLGSTQKMGAGTNVQDRLIALHNLDCPWKPSELEQRQGKATLPAVTSDIPSVCLPNSPPVRFICLKPRLICCPTPPT